MASSSSAAIKQIKENINKWDELSPLSETQLKSVTLLGSDDFVVPIVEASAATPKVTTTTTQDEKKDPLHKVNEEINELLYNFDINDIEDPRVEKYLQSLNANVSKCAQLSDAMGAALAHLNMLLDNYARVSNKTNSLHVACEQLLSDQTKLVNASFLLQSRLSYFTDMDVFMQKLSSPTLETNCEYVIPMLTRIDECLNYLESNPSFKESVAYMQTVRFVLRKALHVIKNYTVNFLNSTTSSLLQQVAQEQQQQPSASSTTPGQPQQSVIRFSADNAYTLFYSKFRVNAHRIKTLMEQLEHRVELNNQPDYEQALSECHRSYVQQRIALIYTPVVNAINELVAKHQRDTCSLVRSSCSFIIHLCHDESQLFNNFFGKNSVFFEKFLEDLCLVLYDRLRPIIIHVVHIETLAELCSILKTEILMDNVKSSSAHDQLSAFESVCTQMLEDVQERFVYRTHIYIREEVLMYAPSAGDLAYPQKLEIMEQIAENLRRQQSAASAEASSSSESEGPKSPLKQQQQRMSPADVHGMWYPTLKRTLVCISKLYRCLDKKTFEGLAQETLSLCVQSLIKAADLIKKSKTQNDGDLFLIKHLLILREQLAPFNNEFSVVEMQLDFTRIKDAAFGLVTNKKSKMFHLNRDNAFLDFLLNGTLQVKENVVDSKREVDNQLKRSCETFIENVSQELFGSVRALIAKIHTVLQMVDATKGSVSLRQQPFAKPEQLRDVFSENYKDIKKKLPVISHAMAIYLANADVENIILKRVKNNMQQTYLEISQIITKHYNEEDQLIIACPTSEQIAMFMIIH